MLLAITLPTDKVLVFMAVLSGIDNFINVIFFLVI
jgi:hypothetical protein